MIHALRIPRPLRAVFLALGILLVCTTAIGAVHGADRGPEQASAQNILTATGVRGGLIVHVGCGDGRLTAALSAGESYLVHGLDTDAANVDRARAHIRSLGLERRVAVAVFDGAHLPYVDELADLVVADTLGDVAMDEVLRVLAPLGVAYIKQDGRWQKTVKPWPEEIDEWTHYLHDASNNAVAHDERIGAPRHLQWQCGPRWSRHHDHMASVSAMVSARGRVFTILDEGSRVSPQLPSDWKLVARGAFSGVLLWKRSIERWHDQLWPLKSGPASLPRRLVAEGDVVYATLGIDAPVAALDAASGETLREYENTAGAEEIVLKDGVLLVVVNRTPVDLEADLAADPEKGKSRDSRTTYSPRMARLWAGVRSRRWTHGDRVIRAFDAQSGRPLWEKEGLVIPLTLAADADHAYYHDGQKIVALDLATGKPQWTSPPVPVWQGLDGQGLQSWFAPTLVACQGKVLFAGGEKMHMSYMGWGSKDIGQDTMTAFSAATGEKLWTAEHPYSGYNSPEDLFVARGKVWTGKTAQGGDGRYTGHDLATGELEHDFPPTVNTFWFHHRCYRAKATDRYILCSRTGIELVDLETGEWTINHWVRGGCLYGIMPSNGLIYTPPHPCACYPEAKLYGFTALAPASPSRSLPEEVSAEGRLERGPAYAVSPGTASSRKAPRASARGYDGQSPIANAQSAIADEDWPMYRHDAARSGAAPAKVSPRLKPAWEVALGGRLTQPVAAGGRLFLADVDRHTVHAIDAASGKHLWSFAAGGRVDSPPTIYVGRTSGPSTGTDGPEVRPTALCIFGSADGYVYCLRADDGAPAWRFRAAPVDRRMVAFDQVESVWPVHGSVLVQDGVATLVAGRSMYLDGGLRLCRLDAATGRLLSEKVLDDRDPETGQNMQRHVAGLNMPVALPDILSSDGEHLYMRSQVMDLQGNRLGLGPGNGGRDHLFAAYGFTDDSWFHRTYWLFGDSFKGGVGGFGNARAKPAGRILVNNATTVFGYGRKPAYFRWASVADYHLFAAPRPDAPRGAPGGERPAAPKRGKRKPAVEYLWTREVPLMARALVLAGDTLFLAGPADLLDEEAAFQDFSDEAVQKQLALQDAALKGRRGALLLAVDAATGDTLAERRLDAPPVFDGMIVAGGRLLIATMDGRLVALAEESATDR